MRFLLILTTLASSTLASESPCGLIYYRPVERAAPKTIECDVAVYGGTPGGFAAAVRAARLGKKVVLLSFDGHVSGLTSAGLTATDVGKNPPSAAWPWSFMVASASSSISALSKPKRASVKCSMKPTSLSSPNVRWNP